MLAPSNVQIPEKIEEFCKTLFFYLVPKLTKELYNAIYLENLYYDIWSESLL